MPTDTDTQIENETVTTETEQDHDDAIPDGLNDGGKAALKAERDAKRLAVKEAREAKAELDRLRAEKAEADRIKAEQDEAEAVKRGEFEQLATKRAEELQTVAGERDGLKARLATAEKLLAANVDAQWKDVPEAVAELYDGDADDPLAKLSFIDKNAKVIAALKDKDDATRKGFDLASRMKTPNPDPTGKQAGDEDARKSQARLVSKF